MDEIDKLINDLEEKSKTSFEEIDLLLDSVDNLIQNTNKELSSENKPPPKISPKACRCFLLRSISELSLQKSE